jgi:hypothetical protein
VQVHCDEGVANYIGPKPCADICEEVGEASVGERAGQPLSRERKLFLGADAVCVAEGKTFECAIASAQATRRGRRTWHARTLFVREPGDLRIGRTSSQCDDVAILRAAKQISFPMARHRSVLGFGRPLADRHRISDPTSPFVLWNWMAVVLWRTPSVASTQIDYPQYRDCRLCLIHVFLTRWRIAQVQRFCRSVRIRNCCRLVVSALSRHSQIGCAAG